MSRERGQIEKNYQSGNAIIGTDNCEKRNRIRRNGITSKIIRYVMDMSFEPRIGLTAANLTF